MRHFLTNAKRDSMNETIQKHYEANFNMLVKRYTFRAGTVWDAEDAVQDAYERAIKYFDSFNPEQSSFGAWFSRIVSNALKDQYAKTMGRNEVEFEEDFVDGVPCSRYEDKIVAEIAERIAVRKPHIAEILRLFFVKGYGAKDISRIVESNHVAVNQTIFRFRRELEALYK